METVPKIIPKRLTLVTAEDNIFGTSGVDGNLQNDMSTAIGVELPRPNVWISRSWLIAPRNGGEYAGYNMNEYAMPVICRRRERTVSQVQMFDFASYEKLESMHKNCIVNANFTMIQSIKMEKIIDESRCNQVWCRGGNPPPRISDLYLERGIS